MAVLRFIKKNTVFCVAAIAAIATSFFVPPDREYLTYFDWKTLACLFLTLAVICALRNIKFFTIVARRLVLFSGNLRSLYLMLIFITFLGSMIIANDMALITFLPLGYFALTSVGKEKHMAFTFIMQKIPTGEFCLIMLPPFLLAVGLLCLACLFVKKEKLVIDKSFPEKLDLKKTTLYIILFLFAILIVFRIIPFIVGLILVPIVLFFVDREALYMVDYALLGTFFFFFIFAGNLSRIDAVNTVISSLLEKDTLLVSTFSCQFISNVPSAILLSRFTGDYRSLLLGVNIGGTGTLIASLASLITFSEFRILYPGHTKQYFWMFTVINFIFLFIMTLVARLFLV